MTRYKKVVHYSKHTREEGHPGGVEKFAWYLAQCIDVEVVTPKHKPVLDDPEVLYIVDNHLGLDIGAACRVVCVLHGCAADKGFSPEVGARQAQMARRPNTRFVANSLQTQLLCQRYYGCKSEVIRLAVDESKYWPPIPHTGKRWLTTTAKKPHKGSRVMPFVKWLLPPSIELVTMDCAVGDEADVFRSVDGFLLLSTHEGFAFSVLEAMAANLPVVCGNHGIAYELGHINVLDDVSLRRPNAVVRAIKEASQVPAQTRQWVLDECSLGKFGAAWQRVIDEEFNR